MKNSKKKNWFYGFGMLILCVMCAVAFYIGTISVKLDSSSLALPTISAVANPVSKNIDALAIDSISRVVTVEALTNQAKQLGTAWLIDKQGDFVTNAHVVAGQVVIRLRERSGVSHAARILGVDREQDVAVLRSADGFPGKPLVVNMHADPAVGSKVLLLSSNVATGHAPIIEETVSDLDSSVRLSETSPTPAVGPAVYRDMVQLNGEAVFQGNSGGPVLDPQGLVVGIVTLAVPASLQTSSTPQSYAIPIRRVIGEINSFSSAP